MVQFFIFKDLTKISIIFKIVLYIKFKTHGPKCYFIICRTFGILPIQNEASLDLTIISLTDNRFN